MRRIWSEAQQGSPQMYRRMPSLVGRGDEYHQRKKCLCRGGFLIFVGDRLDLDLWREREQSGWRWHAGWAGLELWSKLIKSTGI